MVQCVLSCRATKLRMGWAVCLIVLLLIAPVFAGKSKKTVAVEDTHPDLLLEGGRKLSF